TTIKTTALLLLTAGAVALGLGAALHVYAGGQQGAAPQAATAKAAPDEAPKAPPAAPRAEAAAVTVSGQVLDSDGKPFAGAKLFVVTRSAKKEDLAVKATTGEDGGFRVSVAQTDLDREAKLVAAATGHGPDWIELGKGDKVGTVTLRLVKDDVPVAG